MNDAFMTDIGTDTASTVTARYYKGLGNHKDNLVVKQIGRLESDKRDKQAGNGVTVEVVYQIAKKMK